MKDPILILHGWGRFPAGQHRFNEVKLLLERRGYTVFTPDLPGFGSNPLKKEELFFDDYLKFVKKFIEENKVRKVVLLGHSFGGRIAIAFSARYPQLVSKLILVSPSGIPHPLPSMRKKAVFILTKIIKPFFSLPVVSNFYTLFRKLVYYALGEMDYYKAGNLSKTFKNIYQVSIIEDLPKVKAPTLLVWGANDTFVPVADGMVMHEKIKKSQLVIEKDAGHKFPYENPEKFIKDIVPFLSNI